MKPSQPVEEDILDRFQSLMRHVAESRTPEFLGVDVTMPQAKVLYVVSVRPGASMSAIAGELGVGLPAISGLVDRLVALGYLERREGPDDRRQQLITITEPGTAALGRMRELHGDLMRRLLRGLEPPELDALCTGLAALDREVQGLDRDLPEDTPEAQPERTSA